MTGASLLSQRSRKVKGKSEKILRAFFELFERLSVPGRTLATFFLIWDGFFVVAFFAYFEGHVIDCKGNFHQRRVSNFAKIWNLNFEPFLNLSLGSTNLNFRPSSPISIARSVASKCRILTRHIARLAIAATSPVH